MNKQASPSISETAFNCPHCGAYAHQKWLTLYAKLQAPNNSIAPELQLEYIMQIPFDKIKDERIRNEVIELVTRISEGYPFLEKPIDNIDGQYVYMDYSFYNVFVSVCFNCERESIWIYDKLVYPQRGEAPPANPDLSDEIRRDYDEASSILDLSPRGAAALIRLALQKLTKELGKSGDLNKDIRELVEEGLEPAIQQALDVVRVIGNNAVHPGQIELRDNREIAENLFGLLNLIADRMISRKKQVEEIYMKLPKTNRQAIERADSDQ